MRTIADRVIERCRNRTRPLMPDDETVIRVLADSFVENLRAKGEYPQTAAGEQALVETVVACFGNLEFEVGKQGGFELRMRAPDDSLYPEDAR